jgi:hypothetical protein
LQDHPQLVGSRAGYPPYLDAIPGGVPLNRSKFVAFDRSLGIERILSPPNPNASLFEIELVQPHRYRLRNAQGVAVHHEEQQMIANAVTTVLGGIEQPLDLGFIKVCVARNEKSSVLKLSIPRQLCRHQSVCM